jgi:hypothetical protein
MWYGNVEIRLLGFVNEKTVHLIVEQVTNPRIFLDILTNP